MDIVRGSGKSRRKFVFPCAEFVKSSPDAEVRQARNLICGMLDIPVPEEAS